ncbi:response regulator [Schauerella aestuarii]|uniref:response regulator n=1 Tax=Schauerella aestuarii TaxID=2511204 RepID=UPI00136C5BCB|nr:response regulator [Achromobacter aestuarii]MYZ43369.1 response regulator [Achromobacter aestuarii]
MDINVVPPTPSAEHRPLAYVVDDEPLLAELTSELLDDMGFEVVTHTCPLAALEDIERRGTIALLVTDMQMPGISGYQLVDGVRRLQPQLAVVFVSGYSDRFFGNELNLPHRTAFLCKPYLERDMKMAVASVLQAFT